METSEVLAMLFAIGFIVAGLVAMRVKKSGSRKSGKETPKDHDEIGI